MLGVFAFLVLAAVVLAIVGLVVGQVFWLIIAVALFAASGAYAAIKRRAGQRIQ